MANKIMFFIRKERLSGKGSLGLSSDISNQLAIDTTNPYISYKEGDSIVFLVYDQLNIEDFKRNVWDKINDMDKPIYYVHHTFPVDAVKNYLNEEGVTGLEGTTQEGLDKFKYYEPLKAIIPKIINDGQ